MQKHTKHYNCPNCGKYHVVTFSFLRPQDHDVETEIVDCQCGCKFRVECTIYIEYDFDGTEPEVL